MDLNDFEVVIGLEVHCQLMTKTKLFCSCSTEFGATANSQTCCVCLGLPGSLPSMNKEAVKKAVLLAKALECQIQETSFFDRKQYFYQDLPKGYQITQFSNPYCLGGGIKLSEERFIPLRRIHLEEDAGKSFHRKRDTLVDLNRAGIPLVEIVTEPEIRSSDEAVHFFRKLHTLVIYLGVSDGNMEEGSLRCDANVSLRLKGSFELGTRCEIKNINSFKFLEKALDYEVKRQFSLLKSGERIIQQTRQYDDTTGNTVAMRSKEDSEDYRYFPDPDLKPLFLSDEFLDAVTLPELPDDKKRRFIDLQVSESDSEIIVSDIRLCQYFEKLVDAAKPFNNVKPKLISNWVIREVLSVKGHLQKEDGKYGVCQKFFLDLLDMLSTHQITAQVAKSVFQQMLQSGENPRDIVAKGNLGLVLDDSEVEKIVREVIQENPKQLEEYLQGKDKLIGFFVGQTMRKSTGRFSPTKVNEVVLNVLTDFKETKK